MEKVLLVLENDWELTKDRHPNILRFMKKFDGEVIEMTNLPNKTKEEIWEAVNKCTDIGCQTVLVNESQYQFERMLKMLSMVKESKNIFISYYDLESYFERYVDNRELVSIKQHKIYKIISRFDDPVLLDFSERVKAGEETILLEEEEKERQRLYRVDRKNHPTGRKIKIIGCNANGEFFTNLPIGETVDELDPGDMEVNASRGVWIWGNGEPIKLVNDCGAIEYEVVSDDSTKITTAEKKLNIIINDLPGITRTMESDIFVELRERIDLVLNNDEEENSMELANDMCEFFEIPKRSNRRRIIDLIEA